MRRMPATACVPMLRLFSFSYHVLSPQRRHWSQRLSSGGSLDSMLVARVQRKTRSPRDRELTRLECLARPSLSLSHISLTPSTLLSGSLPLLLYSLSSLFAKEVLTWTKCNVFLRRDAAGSRRRMRTRRTRTFLHSVVVESKVEKGPADGVRITSIPNRHGDTARKTFGDALEKRKKKAEVTTKSGW